MRIQCEFERSHSDAHWRPCASECERSNSHRWNLHDTISPLLHNVIFGKQGNRQHRTNETTNKSFLCSLETVNTINDYITRYYQTSLAMAGADWTAEETRLFISQSLFLSCPCGVSSKAECCSATKRELTLWSLGSMPFSYNCCITR